MAKLKQQTEDAVFAPMKNALGKTGQLFDQTFAKMITSHKGFTQELRQGFAELEKDAAVSFMKMAEHQLEAEIRQRIVHQESKIIEQATDQAGATATKAISEESSLAQLNHAAAVAAGKAWSAMADIPVIGPALGAVAAATTYAGVMAFGSAEGGADLPAFAGGAPFVLHSREMVLPAEHADTIRGLRGGGGGVTTNNDNRSLTYNGARGESPHDVRKNLAELERARRDGKLRF
jgi:hypothetical protein